MSKQDLIEYTLDNFGKYQSLQMHLSDNFYPPMPEPVKKVFLDAFNQYWAYMIDVDGLLKELARVYRGGLDQYGFWNFLHEEDLYND